ncbi:MAG: hypothetical protein K2Q27_09400 [Novosphingobium sp.]|nr:hypothetical protein [Novosphingobium sp.]
MSTQCVKAIGGIQYVATVKWYDPAQVDYTPPSARGDNPNTPEDEAVGFITPKDYTVPLKEEKVTLTHKSCVVFNADTQKPRLALISADGADKIRAVITGVTATVVALGGGVVCVVATAGTTCPLVAGAVTTIVTGAIGIGGGFLKESTGIFYVGTPASLEIEGTVLQQIWHEAGLGTKEAFYRAEIDFCHSALNDTETNDPITIELLGYSGTVIKKEVLQGGFNCRGKIWEREPLTVFADTAQIVKAVRVSTTGSNAMFIDQAKVTRDHKTAIVWEGRDNGNGWCLSTDPMDFQGGWENNVAGQCQSSYTFDKAEVETFGSAPGATAAYRARIDFCHSAVTDTNTSGNITIDFMKQGAAVASKTINGAVSDCGTFSKGYLETTINTPVAIDAVRVNTDSGDAMFIDQVEVWRDDIKVFWDGRNDGKGWCISTDPEDFRGGWEDVVSTSCQRSWVFNNLAN